jgi:hypothetical protein
MIKARIISVETGEIIDSINDGDRVVRKQSIDYLKRKSNADAKECLKWDLTNFMKMNIPEIHLWMSELSQSEKAFLFSIVPYVSYDDCHLQINGVDVGTEDLVFITGLSRSLVYSTIDSLVAKDILYRGKNSKNRQYFVNPWIFCKGNMINKVLKTMFKNYKVRVCGGKKWGDMK